MVFTITVFIWGMSYLKGHDFFKRVNYYHIVYDRVDGLQESCSVTLNGFKIGQVREIKFTDDGTGRLLVTFMAESSFKIPVNSVAKIISSDIMGTKEIKLIFNPGKESYQSNDTIPGAIESDLKEQVSLQVLPLKSKAEQLLATIDSAITILTVIFNEDARDNLSESFENISQAIANIEKTTEDLQSLVAAEKGNIGNLIGNMNAISEEFKNNTDEFSQLMGNLAAISDSISSISFSPVLNSLAETSKQIQGIVSKINSEEGTAGKLINDPQLYSNFLALTENLDRLLKDMRTNPKRYLHFSAFDLGKEVYITSGGNKNDNKIVYRVSLVSTSEKIPLDSPVFEGLGKIEEYAASGAYSYLAGVSGNYSDVVELHEKAKIKFPDAAIVAFKNGKQIRLDRALKKIE